MEEESNSTVVPTYFDADGEEEKDELYGHDDNTRTIAISVIFVVTVIGNGLVLNWLFVHRRERTRIHVYMTFLALADLSVAMIPLLVSLIMTLKGNVWEGTDAGCRIRMLMESMALMASSNMVVAIAVDRYHSVMFPLRKQLSELKVIPIAFALALLLSLPQLYVFRKDDFNGTSHCKTIFKPGNDPYRQAYLIYIAAVVFIIPFLVISVAYLRIVAKLYSDGKNLFQSNWKKSTRWRTLKMTFVIIAAYVICNLPYFTIELIRAIAGSDSVNVVAYSIFSVFAPCSSASNPYTFLFFNACRKSRNRKQGQGATTQTAVLEQSTTPRLGREVKAVDCAYKPARSPVKTAI
ncbi:neuropeptide S receptor-like [Patiria miniata]|uniref:G-protein coupled receptors family 1 profile domain-containing protein n=1 Tax=Patiria miniata TaxID=46514 RepID=A0A914BTW9_PATMI|nr:neuropeptide S receptor-like [Patiria miniata]